MTNSVILIDICRNEPKNSTIWSNTWLISLAIHNIIFSSHAKTVARENICFSSLISAGGHFAGRNICNSATEISYWWRKICLESAQKHWLDDGVVTLFQLLFMKGRQKATKVKSKRDECITKQSIFLEYVLSWKKHLSFAGACSQMNTTLYQNRPGETQNWLPDLLCKHWFMSSVWNFCR